MKPTNKQTLLLIALVCIVPVAASYFFYYYAPPSKTMNYGELVETRPLPAHRLTALDGRPFSLAELKGKWIMLQLDASACGEGCRQKLYYMRQVRKAQAQEMDRIERVWLVTDGGIPGAELLREFEGTHVARAGDAALLAALPAAADRADHIYLIDPLGNIVLRFPPHPDPKKMIKDLERLLKYSRIG